MATKIRPIVFKVNVDPYNPLGLDQYTMRVRLTSGSTFNGAGTAVCIDQENNIWDWTFGPDSGSHSISMKSTTNFIEVLGINTHDVTDFTGAFDGCANLIALPTNVYFGDGTIFNYFCRNCNIITSIPNYDVHSATNVYSMFERCYNVESGALTMYNQLAALGEQVVSKQYCFTNCGSNTVTGAAELAQIPTDWK